MRVVSKNYKLKICLKNKMLQTKQSVSSSRALDKMARTKTKQHNKKHIEHGVVIICLYMLIPPKPTWMYNILKHKITIFLFNGCHFSLVNLGIIWYWNTYCYKESTCALYTTSTASHAFPCKYEYTCTMWHNDTFFVIMIWEQIRYFINITNKQ